MNEWSEQQKVQGSFVPGNKSSPERMVRGLFIPKNESSTLETNSLGNEQFWERMFHNIIIYDFHAQLQGTGSRSDVFS